MTTHPNRAAETPSTTPSGVYRGDDVRLTLPGHRPQAVPVPFGTAVEGVYFDGYPQLVKQPETAPTYAIAIDKDVMVAMRDGVRIAVDLYRPDAAGERFPALLAWGLWGKDAQEAVAWNWDKPQPYYDSPFWDGTMEAGNFTYTVPRGYVHVIPEPRGIGNSEGDHFTVESIHDAKDIHDLIRWIAKQPWCNGKVGMMGPSSYSWSQANAAAADDVPAELVAIHPDECPWFYGDHFHGMFDTLMYHIEFGRHGNDSTFPRPNRPMPPPLPETMKHLPRETVDSFVREALEHPDIRYNSKWYSALRYPFKSPLTFDQLMAWLHPQPPENRSDRIERPMYIGTPWACKLYIWGSFELFERAKTPAAQKKMIVYPPGFPARPYAEYHDEIVRWYDYWLKGIDNGIMDEPPIKLFVMGINRWKFEHEWPLARTVWTRFHLQPQGGLAPGAPPAAGATDTLTQPAPYLDPTVYCLRYRSAPMAEDLEVTGPVACHIEAAIDTDDTNWMVDLVDRAPDGTTQLLSLGYLRARNRALDPRKSKPHQPIHPRQDGVPVPPGAIIGYDIEMMPTANLFRKGHCIEFVIRNQDDVLSRLGTWGAYMLPFMRTVTHTIHFGKSHVLLPVIPAAK
jgi:hypothetical protein